MAAEKQAKPATEAPTPEKPATTEAVEVKNEVTEPKPEPKLEDEPPTQGGNKGKEEPAKEEGGEPKEEPKGAVEEPVDPEKKALDELKQLLSAAIANKEFSKKKVEEKKPAEEPKKEESEEPKKPAEEEKKEEPTKPEEPKVEKKPEEEAKPQAPIKPEEPPTPEEKKEEKKKPEEKEKLKEVMAQDKKAEAEAKKEVVAEEEKKKKPEETPPPKKEEEEEEEEEEPPSLWGVPLLDAGEKSDTILLKFLRARDMKPKDALAMIKNTVAWRRSFGADGLPEEDIGVPEELEKAMFMHGVDREGHPVCYNVSGMFENKQLFESTFGDEEKRKRFVRWRVRLLEKGIRELLDFGAGGVNTMVQVSDVKGSRWLWKMEIRLATTDVVHILQDNYPEFVATQVFINVPWWYLAYHRVMGRFIDQRTKNKFVYAAPSRSAEMLFKYVAPEQVPVRFGGLSKENDPDFCVSDAVTDVSIKPSSGHTVEIPVSEACVLVWELRVLGWDVSYGAEFVPDAEGGYTVIVQKVRKVTPSDEPVEKNSFKIGEPGKIVLTVDNATSKKKKLLYRYKTKTKSSHES